MDNNYFLGINNPYDFFDCFAISMCNILVSAAAGSGKTRVLTERIVSRLTDESDPVDIDRILVLTFTKAAAAEMRERISSAINEAAKKKDAPEHIKKQAILIHNAQITTIDSFCLNIIKNKEFIYNPIL